jgi:hypothetical protein
MVRYFDDQEQEHPAMSRLISRLTKLEQQFKAKIDPYLAEIQKIAQIRARLNSNAL